MRDAVLKSVVDADVLIMAAAVSDFRPANIADQKIKKTGVEDDHMQIELARNPDILLEVKNQQRSSGRPLVKVGFAAETQDIVAHGSEKLETKGLDLIVVNDVNAEDAGFGTETNRVILLNREGVEEELPLLSKTDVAAIIIQRTISFLNK
jgi:phosphopantothenoylcysteine decarboxylase/phosphopantothenate--cysteine ligase